MTTTPTTDPTPSVADRLLVRRLRVREVNQANGWFEDDRSFGEGIALLHSEVAEALEAYRSWGLEDRTRVLCAHKRFGADYDAHDSHLKDGGHLCKPQGVGSELADVLVRLLDETDRQDVPLDLFGRLAVELEHDRFGDLCADLHGAIDKFYRMPSIGQAAAVYGLLAGICDRFDIDLDAEFARKLAFNATRGHKHGGKRL